MRRLTLALFTVACITVGSVPPASADIAGSGPDESVSQPFGPLTFGGVYFGSFATPTDVDYLAFAVQAGQSIHVTVANGLSSCRSPDDDGCPVYATLMDGTDQQVGGPTSAAGTVATVGDVETINWTFGAGGTYYVLMESNGNLPNGSPTYAVRVASGLAGGGGSGGGSGGGGGAGRILRSLQVPAFQRGYAVKGRFVLAQRAALVVIKVSLLRANRPPLLLVARTRHNLRTGPHALALQLPVGYRQAIKSGHVLKLRLRLTIVTAAGAKRAYTRTVTLRR